MSLQASLLHLFPDYQEGDWFLQDDGNGPYVREWNRPEPQPPQGQIDAVTQAQRDRANKNARFKRDLESSNKDEALITWIAGKHGLTYQQALDEIKVIFEGL
jgi:hypothetical protein